MIEERLKITNLEDRLKTEMTGGGSGGAAGGLLGGDVTTEALRLALQQEERLKQELGNLKSMESLLGSAGNLKNMESLLGSAGMARMLQMMDADGKTISGGLESGPGSSSGSVPHSPKNSGQHHESNQGSSPETNHVQQIRRDVELTKVSGSSETNLQYQRDIGAHNYRNRDMEEDNNDEEEIGGDQGVYAQDMSTDAMTNYRQEMSSHLDTAMVYPQSPMYQQQNHHATSQQSGMTTQD